jgi:lysozyme
MQPRFKMSREGLELLKSFEGLRLAAARLADGRWTMGHGHTQYAREGATITEADAEALLLYDLIPVVAAVNEAVTVEISQNQFDALVCFAFNVGVEAFRNSEVLTRVNQERMTEAALAMAIWRAGAFDGRRIVLDALVRRRSAEEALLLGPRIQPAPSDMVRPEVDPTAEAALPDQRPAEIEVAFDGDVAQAEVTEYPADETDAAVTPPIHQDDPGAPATGSPADELEPADEAAPDQAANDTVLVITPQPTPIAEIDEPVEGAIMPPAPPEPSPTISETSVSTRIYSTYPTEPFAPLSAAEPIHDEGIPLDIAPDADPAVTSDLAEPPLVLVLTPPPEVAEPVETRPAFSDAEREAGSEDQSALFDPDAAVVASEDGGVIYYEPLTEAPDGKARWSDVGAHVATGAVGLAAFGFGVAGFRLAAESPAPDGVFDEKSAIAWVLVVIGTICVGASSYHLFKRFGADSPE